jgi:hypothetical protein
MGIVALRRAAAESSPQTPCAGSAYGACRLLSLVTAPRLGNGPWAALCTVLILAACAVLAAEPWRIVEQPELGQRLEQVPLLKTESLGEPPRGVNVWKRWMVPNLDGQTWDVLEVYFTHESLTRGPDGFVWTYLKDVLVRINPQDATVHVVGPIAPVGYPTFVGQELYLFGPEQSRRIRNVVSMPSSRCPRPGALA